MLGGSSRENHFDYAKEKLAGKSGFYHVQASEARRPGGLGKHFFRQQNNKVFREREKDESPKWKVPGCANLDWSETPV